MKEVCDLFFNNIKTSVIVKAAQEVCVVYGRNKQISKYYGLLDPTPHNKSIKVIA
jgi:hypothetical protein